MSSTVSSRGWQAGPSALRQQVTSGRRGTGAGEVTRVRQERTGGTSVHARRLAEEKA
jgi:hypothetical protein